MNIWHKLQRTVNKYPRSVCWTALITSLIIAVPQYAAIHERDAIELGICIIQGLLVLSTSAPVIIAMLIVEYVACVWVNEQLPRQSCIKFAVRLVFVMCASILLPIIFNKVMLNI